MQSIFRPAVRRETPGEQSEGWSPRRWSKNALHYDTILGSRGPRKLSLWEFIWPNFFARFLGISVPTSYPADHKGFRCRFDRLFYYPLQSVDLENSPAPQIQGCLKASHLQLGPELLFWLHMPNHSFPVRRFSPKRGLSSKWTENRGKPETRGSGVRGALIQLKVS
jgi:hypothetical protein